MATASASSPTATSTVPDPSASTVVCTWSLAWHAPSTATRTTAASTRSGTRRDGGRLGRTPGKVVRRRARPGIAGRMDREAPKTAEPPLDRSGEGSVGQDARESLPGPLRRLEGWSAPDRYFGGRSGLGQLHGRGLEALDRFERDDHLAGLGIGLGVDDDVLAGAELLPEQPLGQGVLDHPLDGSAQRPGAQRRVVALVAEQGLGRRR